MVEEAAGGGAALSGRGLGQAVRISRLAEGYILAGRVSEALTLAHTAIDLSRQHKERANEAIGLRVLAEVMARSDPLDATGAAAQYAGSLAIAESLGMRPLVAHCHLGLGRLYRRAGNRDQARERLTSATTMYREMEMRSWLAQAEGELGELGP